ncbi:MAG: cytochrome c-type biosis protein CcmF [Thermoleophilaceae bacterium]|nr:cytochrome c-type biosis protein CcmF [Thermoleophilaceae bacterium]
MADVGWACLVVGLLVATYSCGAALYGALSGKRQFVVSARRGMYFLAGLMVLAFVLIEAAFARSDFSFNLVASYSSTDTPLFYKLTAVWSSQEGSLLLWVFLLSIMSSVALYTTRRRHREIAPYANAVLSGIAVFFLGLIVLKDQNPFATLARVPAEGSGLNPLLRHPAMMFHPPCLYAGYVGFSIPFAFMVGALITRRTSADWIRSTRRFAMIAWTFLGTGILLGALWSYSELDWGGYWAWDAVENAALMPWIVSTAFLHSVMVQEKRGMLKIWNASLIAATFVLSLLGTFLVRSGVLDSIHAFGASTLGTPFLAFIGLVAFGSVVLIVVRRESLRSKARLDSLLSREAFFLLNNLMLVALCVVIFWGTYFPLISEALTGQSESVGPVFFSRITTPIALVLVLLTGIGPLLAWRRGTPRQLVRTLVFPVAVALVVLIAMLALTTAGESGTSLVMFTFIGFVLAAVGQEFWRGTRARRRTAGERLPVAFVQLIGRNRRRYGGYTAHAGLSLVLLGVAASSAFMQQQDLLLKPGQTGRVGDYRVTYDKPTGALLQDQAGTGAPVTLGAVLTVRKGDQVRTYHPARNYYPASDGTGGPIGRYFEGEANTEVDQRWGILGNFWTAVQPDLQPLLGPIAVANRKFGDADPQTQAIILAALVQRYRMHAPAAHFRVIYSPMVMWIWIGGLVIIIGSLTALWPSPDARRRRAASLAKARLGRELSRA